MKGYLFFVETITIFFAVGLASAYATSPPNPQCLLRDCGGPWRFYADLRCKPVYKNPSDCCPMRYDCDHLKNRPKDKCHAFGREYKVGEEVHGEAGTLGCFPPCKCIMGPENKARFTCAIDSPQAPPRPECYRPRNATVCVHGPEICFDTAAKVPTCQVDERIVKAGEYFSPSAEPWKDCWCGPGYRGENGRPFCKDTTREYCRNELHHTWEIENHCSPLYEPTQDVSLDCNDHWRCHEHDDKIIPSSVLLRHSSARPAPTPEPGMQCRLGPLTLQHNEGINRKINNKCAICVCEVPPALTCVNAPIEACDLKTEGLHSSEEKA